jgi:ER membrane protein complex subunit 2
MTSDLLHVPPSLSPPQALHLSQEAPRVLSKATTTSLPYPLSLLASSETQETWIEHENIFLCCLRTGDDKSARQCLDRLIKRFGDKNEKIMALKGMYEEAVAKDNKDLEKVLKGYEAILKEDPTNLVRFSPAGSVVHGPSAPRKCVANSLQPIRKRKAALLRSMSRLPEAVSTLVDLLDFSPTDGEAWAELSDLYFVQGLYPQAIYSLEEVLLITPNAWNVRLSLEDCIGKIY